MDLRYTDEENAFRAEVRAWLAEVLPHVPPEPHVHDWAARRVWDTAWQRMLFEAGYAGINWPKEFGGRGATPTEHLIFLEETERARAPYVGMNFVGLLHAGPTLVVEANAEQKAKHLPPILRGDHVWCQGFSEPNAGSDLASLRTRATKTDAGYILNGQKCWITNGGFADVYTVFAKIDGDKFTAFILERGMEGFTQGPEEHKMGIKGSSTVQLYFQDCKVPVENLLGEPGKGHVIAFNILNLGRLKLAMFGHGECKEALAHSLRYARERKAFGKSIGEFGLIQQKLAEMSARMFANESRVMILDASASAAWISRSLNHFSAK